MITGELRNTTLQLFLIKDAGVSNKLCNPSQNIRHILFCITIRNFDNAVNDWNKLVNKFWRFQL